jgi:hypothetical protein
MSPEAAAPVSDWLTITTLIPLDLLVFEQAHKGINAACDGCQDSKIIKANYLHPPALCVRVRACCAYSRWPCPCPPSLVINQPKLDHIPTTSHFLPLLLSSHQRCHTKPFSGDCLASQATPCT